MSSYPLISSEEIVKKHNAWHAIAKLGLFTLNFKKEKKAVLDNNAQHKIHIQSSYINK